MGRLQHHAGVPVEGFALLQEDAGQALHGFSEGGEAKVEGPDADGGEVVDGAVRGGAHAAAPSCRSPAPVRRRRVMIPAMSPRVASALRRVNFR